VAKKSSRRRSEKERAERRCADRERLRRAAEELLSSEGWARWVRVRASFRAYSAGNCMLLAHQCHERGIDPQYIAGFRSWLKLGRCVRKGERALRIFAPMTFKERRRAWAGDGGVAGVLQDRVRVRALPDRASAGRRARTARAALGAADGRRHRGGQALRACPTMPVCQTVAREPR
jgi:hypothetical protein